MKKVDKKITIAIVIVALIGIVAATYNATDDENSVFNPLSGVLTDEQTVTDLAAIEANGAGSPTQEDNSNTGINSKNNVDSKNNANGASGTTTQSSNNNQNNANNATITSNGNNNQQQSNPQKPRTNTPTNKTPSSNNTSLISSAQASVIAKNAAIADGLTSVTTSLSEEITANGIKYYLINVYSNGKFIGYYEISSKTGEITGGAFEGEAPNTPQKPSDIPDNLNDNNTPQYNIVKKFNTTNHTA